MEKRLLSLLLFSIIAALTAGCNTSTTDTAETENAITTISFDTSGFEDPTSEYWPLGRFVINGDFGGDKEEYLDGLEAEVRDLYDNGIMGLEIEATSLGVRADSTKYINTLKRLYSVGNELGMDIDLRVGGAGSIKGGTPQAIMASNPYSVKGGDVLSRGDQLKGITELADDNTFNEKLIAVLAIEYDTDSDGTKIQTDVVQLDINDFSYNSIERPGQKDAVASQASGMGGFSSSSTKIYEVTVTYKGDDAVIGDSEDETWDIIAYYKATDADIGGLDFTDFFSQDSAQIIIENTQALFDDELKTLIKENSGLFTVDGGDHNQNFTSNTWSDELISKVEKLYGYDYTDYLAVQYSDYALKDETAAERLNNDWIEAFSYLFGDYVTTLEKWAETEYNTGFRMQIGYCTDLDTGIVTQYVTQADVESFWAAGGDTIDDYNLNAAYTAVTSVSNILRRKITAGNEIGATGTSPNEWIDFLLEHVNKSIYSGVNQMVYHIIECQYGTPWAYGYNGRMIIRGMMSWGASNPQYVAESEYNDYVSRLQYILQNGTAQRDVVIYDHTYYDNFKTSYLINDAIEEAGYTYDIFSPGPMRTKNGKHVENGLIDPSGGCYKAFVITNLLNGDTMPLDTAETILNYAKNGVPIIVVGKNNIPTKTMSYSTIDQDDELAGFFKEIDKMGMLTIIDSQDQLTDTLKSIGVEAYTKKDKSSRIVSYKRLSDDGSTSYYFLYNYATEDDSSTVRQKIYLEGVGIPYFMDLWSGEVTPIANYEAADDGYTAVDVTLVPNEACMIAIVSGASDVVHAVDMNNNMSCAYDENGNIVLRATEAGEYSVELSNGTNATAKIESVAPAISLDSWKLSVESWYTEDYQSNEIEFGVDAEKAILPAVELDRLLPWNEIDEIGEQISGVGTYTTTFSFDGNYDGAILSLGSVFDTVLAYVNDHQVYINMVSLTADISDCLVEGENTLKVVAPSDLHNILLANTDLGAATSRRMVRVDLSSVTYKAYGLLGPVSVTPYVNVNLGGN